MSTKTGDNNGSGGVGSEHKLGHEHEHEHEHGHEHEHSHNNSHEEHTHGHTHAGGASLFTHSHSHHQPNELLATGKGSFNNPAVRITWIGLLVNVGMAITKGVGGVYFHSQALVADAIHSVSDMVADFLTLATVNMAYKTGTPTKFPLGYGKIETVGSLMVSTVLLVAGISVGWSSLLLIFEYVLPAYIYDYASMIQIGHSHSHSHTQVQTHSHSHATTDVGISNSDLDTPLASSLSASPVIHGAWIAGASILVKEILFKKTMKIAEQTNSKVLVANAWHHRVDSLTSMVALLTITGSFLFNVAWLDSIGGLFVSILIIRTGWSTFLTSWYELIDRGEPVESEAYIKINNIAKQEVQDVTKGGFIVNKLSVMTSGASSNIYITLSETDAKQYLLEELNAIEAQLVESIKRDDKFIKNIFILFKAKGIMETK